jgi:hypothetical protein
MKSFKILLVILLGLGYCLGVAQADEDAVTYYVEDKSPAIRVKNGYDDGTDVRVVLVAGDDATNYVQIGTVLTVIAMNGSADTIAEVAALMAACTNTAGEKKLIVDYDCALAADSTDDETLDDVDTVIRPGAWGEVALWDTSTAKFYSCYIPGSTSGGQDNKKIIRRIYGNIGGTGNITLNIYVDGVEKYEKVIVSPVYVSTTDVNDSDNEHAADAVTPAQLDIPINFPADASEDVMIRATRATTGTTGSIGAIVDYTY